MLGIGFTEMIVLAGIALVVMGPEKFPELAKTFFRTVREIRGYWEEAQSELRKEMAPIKKEMRELEKTKPEDIIGDLANDKDWMDPDVKRAAETGYGAYAAPDPAKEKQPGVADARDWDAPEGPGPVPFGQQAEPAPADDDAPMDTADTKGIDESAADDSGSGDPEDEFPSNAPDRLD
ncbi:MAG: twin-arginine translocase subunit TatB [Candidatus Hydrogenedens sp.]|nr:twin-arginine translocase subunit TatB [Candidatus Hydrogenedens sp.]